MFILETKTFQPHDHDFVESESMQQTLMGDPLSVLGMSLETNRCKPNQTYIWCLPFDYNQEKHPFTCECLVVDNRNRAIIPPGIHNDHFRSSFTKQIVALGL